MGLSRYSQKELRLPPIEWTHFRNISDEQLIEACLKKKRDAWDEFFRRFIPHIIQGIKKALRTYGPAKFLRDEDVLWDIHKKIVVKLYNKGLLEKCRNPSGVQAWLRTVAYNQTVDWLIERGRDKRLPEIQGKASNLSTEETILNDSNLTLGDTLSAVETAKELRTDVEKALNKLENINEINIDKKLWVLRLSLLSLWPLSQREVNDLAKFRGLAVNEVENRLKKIMDNLESKREETVRALGRAVILWHVIRRLEAIVTEKSKSPLKLENKEIKELLDKIQKKSKRREKLLKKGRRFCRPSNKEIGGLIWLPEEKVNQVSNLLKRARNSMQKMIDSIELDAIE